MGKEIGIDFGTTTTEVCYVDKNGYTRAMKLEKGKTVIPTVLFFKSSDEYVIGSLANQKGEIYPSAAVKNFKLSFTDRTARYNVTAENGDQFKIKPVQAAHLFLHELIQIIQPKLIKEFGEENGVIDKAVITVPAQFDPEEKAAVKSALTKAAQMAGFADIRLAAEPTAAAIAYQDENCEDGSTILVYDFGGGTFDVSVIKKQNGVFSEISTDGDKQLGGNVITEKIADFIWDLCCKKTKTTLPFDKDEADQYDEDEYELSAERFYLNRVHVFNLAEEIKIEFADSDECETEVSFYVDNDSDPVLIGIDMCLGDFYDLIYSEIKKTVDLTERVYNDTLKKSDINCIDQVVLAGGSSQIPLVHEMLEEKGLFSGKIALSEDTSTLIARGAAKLASVELNVEEKTRFSIGTRKVSGTRLGEYEELIKVGEKLPCSGKKRFYRTNRKQSEITVQYFEKDVKNYPDSKTIDDEGINLVNELTISGLPSVENLAIDVTFLIEADGTPTISVEILDEEGNVMKAEQLQITKEGSLY